MEYPALNYEKLSDRAKAPKRATPGSIGLDLFTPTDMFIPAKEQVLIHTDLILVPAQGHYIRIASCTVPFTVQPFAYTSCTSRLRAPQGSHRMGDQWHQL